MLYHFDFERNNVKFDKTYHMFKALLTALANTKNRHLKIRYLRKIVSKYPYVDVVFYRNNRADSTIPQTTLPEILKNKIPKLKKTHRFL